MPVYWKIGYSAIQSQLAFALLSFRWVFFSACSVSPFEHFSNAHGYENIYLKSSNFNQSYQFRGGCPSLCSCINLYQIFQKSFENVFVFHKYLCVLWYEINTYFTVFYPSTHWCAVHSPMHHPLIVIVNECLFINSFIWIRTFRTQTGTQHTAVVESNLTYTIAIWVLTFSFSSPSFTHSVPHVKKNSMQMLQAIQW